MTEFTPLGSEFLVNSMTSGEQSLVSVAALVGGGYIICWTDQSGLGGDSSGYSVKAQLYAADGTPIGSEFLVNTNTAANQLVPEVAALDNGGFAITWMDNSQAGGDASGYGVVVRVYAADGSPVTGEISVNTITTGDQVEPYITGLPGGGFAVTWIDYSGQSGDTSASAIRAQVFAYDGSPVGGEILVNTVTDSYQVQPQITCLENGNFVITWADLSGIGGDTSNVGIKAQLFSADGVKIGGEFLVNTETANAQQLPTVTGLVGGGFVISWDDQSGIGGDSSGFGIKAQIYDENGVKVGTEILVNSGKFHDQSSSDITALPDGGFVITWMDQGINVEWTGGIKAQIFSADGSPSGGEILVNSSTGGQTFYPAIATQADGSFVITWNGNGPSGDGIGSGVKAQMYQGEYPSNEPANAQNDAFTTSELSAVSGSLFVDNGSGADTDPDGPALSISEVDGNAANVGTQIMLASGALLTVNADGTFTYNPNGAFQYTPTVGSGASNTPSSDSFTYTLAGGDTATVSLTITGADNNDYILGTPGNDNLGGGPGNDTIYAGDGNDGLRGNGGSDALHGEGGDDFLNGGNGDDTIDGGAGIDRAAYFQTNAALGGITVSLLLQGSAQFVGSQGWDTLVSIENVSGTPFADTITGDAGDNWLWGSTSWLTATDQSTTNNDVIDGGDGNDLIEVGYGNHSLTGGNGNDTLLYSENGGAEVGVTISLTLQGGAQNTGAGNWMLSGFENLAGGTLNDQLTGDGNANILAGYTGNDLLVGGGGNDSLYGDGYYGLTGTGSGSYFLATDADVANGEVAGNDTLEGGLGNDLLNGGGGIDTASYINASGGVSAGLGAGGSGGSFGADGNDTFVSIENITGSTFNDQLGGNADANVLSGGDGHDILAGRAGDDTLIGGTGDDYLRGDDGNDVLDGGLGWDRAAYNSVAVAGVTVDLNVQGVAQNTGQGMDTLIGIENVSGTVFADTLTGNAGDNWIRGWGGDDVLSGGDGNDLIEVGVGNATVSGGAGNDGWSFFGEGTAYSSGVTASLALQGSAQDTGHGTMLATGFENLSGSTLGDVLIGDSGANIIAGDAGNDTLSGGAGNDTLYGDGALFADYHGNGGSGPITTFADLGSGGNDTLEGGLGDDLLNGGIGIDTASYSLASGAVTAFLYKLGNGNGEAFGADGNDTLANIENLTGSAFNDQLSGNTLANVLIGGDGHDGLRGNGGNDTLYGGNGDDFLNGSAGDDYIDGGAGFDRAGFYEDATSAGVTVDLNLQGTAQDTGQGMDTLVNIENVSGSAYGDHLTGDGNDNLLWGSASTLLNGTVVTTNNDTIDGGGGNDVLLVGIGNHSLTGGTGIDTVAFTENGAAEPALTVSLELQGAAQATGAGNWTLIGVENLSGGINNDTLIGDGNANVLAGNTGNDMLVGGAGNDVLYGDGIIGWDTHGTGGSGPITIFTDATLYDAAAIDGNDTLEGGLGNDTLDGGGGIDTATYAHASAAVNVNLGSGTSSGADGNDTLVNIENVTGSAFNDSLTGSGGGNVLDGLGGNDTLSGGAGDDTLYGGDGDDFLQGDFNENNITLTGNDVMYGGNGNDLLRGGLGDDQFYGGANNDQFRGNGGVDYFDGGADDGLGFNGIGDRVSFFEQRATQGVVADLRTGIISNDGFGNVETMVGIESLGGDTAFIDTFYGNDERNYLAGGRGDFVYGFGGDDLFQMISATAVLDGGSGIDRLSLFITGGGQLLPDANGDGLAEFAAAATAGFTVNLTAGTILDGYGFSGTVSGIENVDGTILADTLIGDGNVNVFNSFDGNDLLEGRGGNDTLDGGNGIDTASYANASGAVTVNLYAGTATGADGSDTLANIENVTGSAFNDSLAGNELANVLTGGDGDDLLRANEGNDTLYGGTGNDILKGQDGDDLIDGGAGIDRAGYWHADAALGGVTVSLLLQGTAQNVGSQGWDTLVGIENVFGTPFADSLTGDGGNNWLSGSEATIGGIVSATNNDTIDGQGGNDLLSIGIGNHTLIGGSGIDTLWFTEHGYPETGVTVSLALQGAAQATGNGSWNLSGIENLTGGVANDTLTGDGGTNVLAGNSGNDTLVGGAGNDVLYGDGAIGVNGSGVITTYADVATITLTGIGTDVAVMPGASGNDLLEGGFGNDTLNGGGGIDTATYAHASGLVTVSLNSGTSSGADGNDTLVSIENVTGSGFDDSLTGNAGNNALDGGAGHDLLAGLAGNDTLVGGSGDDLLFGGSGDDQLNGGAGFDRAGYGGVAGGVTVNLNLVGAQNTGGGGIDTLIGIEHLSGTQFNDTLTGDGGDNWLWGASGNDTISGGAGNDLIQVGAGTTTLNGGTGIDTLSFWSGTTDITSAGVAFSLASQGAAQNTRQGMMNASGFENVSGSRYDDVISGDVGNNILLGDTGSDTLNGNDGNDTLYGDGRILADTHQYGTSGPITLFGDVQRDQDFGIGVDGNDTLNGGKGDDTLYGGRGNDIMSGGPGADKFVIEALSGADRIADFAHVDRIVFDPTSGVTAFSQLVFTEVGKDTLITWGNGNSLTIEGYRPRDLTAADFTFGPAAASTFSTMAALSELSRVTSVTGDAMLMGTVAAVGLMSAQAAAQPLSSLEQAGGELSSSSSVVTALSVDLNLAATSSGFGEVSRLALGNEMHELAGTGIADSRSSFADHTASLGGVGPADLGHGMQIGTVAETFTPSSFGNGAMAGLATGVTIPAADTLLAAMGGIDGPMAVDGVDQARGTAEVWRGLGDVLDGLTGHGAEIDALLDSLPSHDGAMQALAAPLGFANTMMTHWMPDVAMSSMEMIAAHPDAVAQG